MTSQANGIGTGIMIGVIMGLAAPTRAIEPAEAVRLVTAGIESNYANIKTLHLRMRKVLETPGGDDEPRRIVHPNGSIETSWMPKRAVISEEVWLTPAKLRVEVTDTTPKAVVKSATFLRSEGIWTEHCPDERMAWIGRNDQMGAPDTLDPRTFGARYATEDVPGTLARNRITSAKWTDAGGGDVLAIDLVVASGQKMSFEFSRRLSFLPTVSAIWIESSVVGTIAIEYETHGPMFLVKRSTDKAFAEGRHQTIQPAANDWTQRTVTEITDVELNAGLPASIFELEIPRGTRVSDAIRGTFHVSGIEEPRRKSGGRGDFGGIPTIVVVLILGVSCVAVFVGWRRFKKTRS